MVVVFLDDPNDVRDSVLNFADKVKRSLPCKLLKGKNALSNASVWREFEDGAPFLVFLHVHFIQAWADSEIEHWASTLRENAVFIIYSQAVVGVSPLDVQHVLRAAIKAGLKLDDGRSRVFVHRDRITFDDELVQATVSLGVKLAGEVEGVRTSLKDRYFRSNELDIPGVNDRRELHHGLSILYGLWRCYLGDRSGIENARRSLEELDRHVTEVVEESRSLSADLLGANWVSFRKDFEQRCQQPTIDGIRELARTLLGDEKGSGGLVSDLAGSGVRSSARGMGDGPTEQ